MIRFFLITFILSNISCAGPRPTKEYTLSRSALKYAKKSGAESYASGWYFKADSTFKEAEKAYKENDNSLARGLFIKARKYAERAENSSKVKKFKSGDGPVD